MLALFVALSGSVYAAAKIDGADIRKKSVPGNRLKPNSLGGKQIKEAKLGVVPLAASSKNVKPIRFNETLPAGDPEVSETVLNLGSLTMTASCSSGAARVDVTTSAPQGTTGFDFSYTRNGVPVEGGLPLGADPFNVILLAAGENDFRRGVGTAVYSDGDETISIQFGSFFGASAESSTCYLAGTATRAGGPG